MSKCLHLLCFYDPLRRLTRCECGMVFQTDLQKHSARPGERSERYIHESLAAAQEK